MTSNPFAFTTPQITASILSADFAELAAEIADVDRGGADFLHLDVLDGHFAPNLSFGPHLVESIRPVTDAFFDAHLMIMEPLRYAPAFLEAGVDGITYHVEVVTDVAKTAQELRRLGCKHVGVVLNPPTPVEKIWPALDHVDHVLVMSVNPGFSGQKFMPEVLPKCEAIKKRLRPNQRLEIDGGIKAENIRHVRDAGVDWFVIASAIFDEPDRAAAIAELRAQLGLST